MFVNTFSLYPWDLCYRSTIKRRARSLRDKEILHPCGCFPQTSLRHEARSDHFGQVHYVLTLYESDLNHALAIQVCTIVFTAMWLFYLKKKKKKSGIIQSQQIGVLILASLFIIQGRLSEWFDQIHSLLQIDKRGAYSFMVLRKDERMLPTRTSIHCMSLELYSFFFSGLGACVNVLLSASESSGPSTGHACWEYIYWVWLQAESKGTKL